VNAIAVHETLRLGDKHAVQPEVEPLINKCEVTHKNVCYTLPAAAGSKNGAYGRMLLAAAQNVEAVPSVRDYFFQRESDRSTETGRKLCLFRLSELLCIQSTLFYQT
jgi:hypothetical protein